MYCNFKFFYYKTNRRIDNNDWGIQLFYDFVISVQGRRQGRPLGQVT